MMIMNNFKGFTRVYYLEWERKEIICLLEKIARERRDNVLSPVRMETLRARASLQTGTWFRINIFLRTTKTYGTKIRSHVQRDLDLREMLLSCSSCSDI